MNPKEAISKLLRSFMTSVRSRGIKHRNFGKGIVIRSGSRVTSYSEKASVTIGHNVVVGKNTEIYAWTGNVKIGDNTSLNDNCKIYENVSIGANCLLASNIFISSGSHVFRHQPTLPIKAQDKLIIQDKPVVIDDDCWLGFGVVVMQGVHIGKGAVIGSNSVITRDVPPYSIQAGIPSKEISQRAVFDPPARIDSGNVLHYPYFYNGIDYRAFENTAELTNGIPVIHRRSMFVLKKTNAIKLIVRGYADATFQIRFSVDGMIAGDIQTENGSFNKTFDISATRQADTADVPASFREKYTICIAEVLSSGHTWWAQSISVE